MKVIQVPTINDQLYDFENLFELWYQVNDNCVEVKFDFSQCHFLRQNAVAFLGGLVRLIQHRSGTVHFDLDSLQNKIRMNLAQNGFLAAFGHPGGPWFGNSIPYREDVADDPESVIDYLRDNWLGRGWVHISESLRDAIVGRVWEIYANAFEHGQSEVGVFSCGQYYRKLRELKLTVVDFGVGIPSNVRLFARNHKIQASKALKWAFMRGTTTKPNGTGRGLGLDLLKEFVTLNDGRLDVFSHEGYALIDKDEKSFSNRSSFFEGTLVNITLKCDESYYHFASEEVAEPLF